MEKIALSTWQKVVKENNLKEAEKILCCCAYDTDFIPIKTDSKIKIWIRKGLTSYCFEELKRDHELEKEFDIYK